MMGSVICENGNTPPIPDRNSLTAEKKRELIKEVFGENTDQLIELFKKGYPGKNELLLLDFDTNYRGNLLPWAERKVNESNPGVPLYVFMLALEFDYDGGKGAWHCSCIPFSFHNAVKVPVYHFDGMEKIEKEMSGAWASFARTGNPNHPGLPEKWPEYNLENKGVMIFDRKSEVRYNHEKELVELHQKAISQRSASRGNRRITGLGDEKWIY
jgi:para-nitrobenzyl esterase